MHPMVFEKDWIELVPQNCEAAGVLESHSFTERGFIITYELKTSCTAITVC